jgi:preprotein translocase subunit SecD
MIAGLIRAKRNGKAGLSGLFCCALLALALLAASANAEPIAIQVISAQAAFDQRTNQPIIAFKMTPVSARLFAELTAKNVGRKMEIRIDGKTVSAPVIREPILGGSGQISNASWTLNEVREIAERLSAGKATIEFEAVNE